MPSRLFAGGPTCRPLPRGSAAALGRTLPSAGPEGGLGEAYSTWQRVVLTVCHPRSTMIVQTTGSLLTAWYDWRSD